VRSDTPSSLKCNRENSTSHSPNTSRINDGRDVWYAIPCGSHADQHAAVRANCREPLLGFRSEPTRCRLGLRQVDHHLLDLHVRGVRHRPPHASGPVVLVLRLELCLRQADVPSKAREALSLCPKRLLLRDPFYVSQSVTDWNFFMNLDRFSRMISEKSPGKC
jgi:hypothetical protein